MERIWHSKNYLQVSPQINWMSSVHAETIVNLTTFGHFCLTAIQIKYPGTRNHTYFCSYVLTASGKSVVKLKHWYFLLVSRDFHYESILTVIMQDRNGNSVAIIAVARVEFSEPV